MACRRTLSRGEKADYIKAVKCLQSHPAVDPVMPQARTRRRIRWLDSRLGLEALDGPDIFRLLSGIHVSPEAPRQYSITRGILGEPTILS